MQFRHVFAAALVALCGVLASNAANALVVNIDATLSYDNDVLLQAGTYTVTYANNGTYQAYNTCGTQGCFDAHTPGVFSDEFAISIAPINGGGVYAPHR